MDCLTIKNKTVLNLTGINGQFGLAMRKKVEDQRHEPEIVFKANLAKDAARDITGKPNLALILTGLIGQTGPDAA